MICTPFVRLFNRAKNSQTKWHLFFVAASLLPSKVSKPKPLGESLVNERLRRKKKKKPHFHVAAKVAELRPGRPSIKMLKLSKIFLP